MKLYFNDVDPFVCRWLQNAFPDARVDCRSVTEVRPRDLDGYDRAHFFAGIGGWELACLLAEWPDSIPLWTASLPCQPFSKIGRKDGFSNERHLWPVFFRLVDSCRPAVLVGEQVASHLGKSWFSRVRFDLGTLGYAVAASDLPAACVGAPHIRQRIFWVAVSNRSRLEGRAGMESEKGGGTEQVRSRSTTDRALAHSNDKTGQGVAWRLSGWAKVTRYSSFDSWQEYELIRCADEKFRRCEPCLSPLADGVPSRVGKIRAYGNAVVPQVAALFLMAVLGILEEHEDRSGDLAGNAGPG